jgi:hypothetical protein
MFVATLSACSARGNHFLHQGWKCGDGALRQWDQQTGKRQEGAILRAAGLAQRQNGQSCDQPFCANGRRDIEKD